MDSLATFFRDAREFVCENDILKSARRCVNGGIVAMRKNIANVFSVEEQARI